MKRIALHLVSLLLLGAPGFLSPVQAQDGSAPDLLATTNRGELVAIDLDAGTAQLIGDAGIFQDREPGWTGLAFDAQGNLFVSSRQASEPSTDGCVGVFATGPCAHLYRLDPQTGAILEEIGSTEIAFLSDIDFAADGTLYGNRFRDEAASGDGGLVIIDPATAGITAFGRFGPGDLSTDLETGGLSVHPQTGEIWAAESSFSASPSLFRVDPQTGLAIAPVIRLGFNGEPSTFGLDALEILPDGRFFAVAGRSSQFFEVNPVPDAQSGLAELTVVELDMDEAISGSLNGLEAVFQASMLHAEIDIKPGGNPNPINLKSKGVIPVAILTTATFDALSVSPSTVGFGPSGAGIVHRSGHLEDVDGDGDLDLLLHFRTEQTGIQCGDSAAVLTGETFAAQPFQGSDEIVTVGCP